ncbi:MAG: hypothetical protein VKN83_03870 [Cyanobacteriota bacterium]|nr:hypothetical protein [Cyanobacteriota bacterium]
MKTIPSVLKQNSALVLALISAVVCHGLFLSYLKLQRNKPTLPGGLKIRDNTPELLQFSSQPAPLSSLDLLPLPKASILPPPPAPLPAKPAEAKQKSKLRSAFKAGILKARPPRAPRTGAVATPPFSPDVPQDLTDAVQALRLFLMTSQQPSTGQEDHPKAVSALPAAQQESYERLWAEAHPLMERSIEIRSLTLQRAQGKELPIRHHQFLVTNDRIGLFWLEGQRLWILQSPLPKASKADSANDSQDRPDR